jgi:hypothetical protein
MLDGENEDLGGETLLAPENIDGIPTKSYKK